MGFLGKLVAVKATLAGLAVGLAVGGALALAAHGAMAAEGRR
jgi:hypothetical protein